MWVYSPWRKGRCPRLESSWVGPCTVTERLGEVVYWVQLMRGAGGSCCIAIGSPHTKGGCWTPLPLRQHHHSRRQQTHLSLHPDRSGAHTPQSRHLLQQW
ncbi:UNVERIFIED_CONTAM: hypothetical protein FKN15_050301 [Acipenser sinensis]